ncbi:TAXI family TRAP transporter solute-binding subunit [Pelagicoccus sp. SDUM812002]|uniref:TAXI family TRAP transporter solute-binding subunit n=1 Tax=Pelagicoccus sp. SDUM812002 TaxID=3041266 RepID=UPI0028103E32|nr:TAXI family TRAP transporter solute-binding subunit [Pelagicoccus sp. SDUM812002]MDQ8184772.1 TAXI family TRAP transporter solute-binding subunit [Pelagicoccus sp. SDUM812002]
MTLSKTFIKANIWAIAGVAVLVTVLFQFVDPAPPKEITIASGSETGRYFELAHRLKDELRQEGVSLNVLTTAGSQDNLERLTAEDSPVSIAFVQSGMEEIFDAGETSLHGLTSLYYEPIWLIYRKSLEVEYVSDLRNRRIAVGEQGSGTKAVAEFLLNENGLLFGAGKTERVEVGGEDAVTLLESGEIDAGFFMVSAGSEMILRLIGIEGFEFLNMRRHEAYRARYRSLTSVPITEGLLDLKQNLPPEDRMVLAAVATLVVNDKFHPSLTPIVLEAMRRVVSNGGVLEQRDEFPSGENVGYPLTKEADHYFEYGPPFLLRFMPFWAASLVDRLVILIIPLLVILIPLGKLAGPVYRWRIRSRIYKWYKYLRETDQKIVGGTIQDNLDMERERLEKLENELASVEVPLSYSDELYHLRQHVEYVSRRLKAIEAGRSEAKE